MNGYDDDYYHHDNQEDGKGFDERADPDGGGVLGRSVGITRLRNIQHISTNETILALYNNTVHTSPMRPSLLYNNTHKTSTIQCKAISRLGNIQHIFTNETFLALQ